MITNECVEFERKYITSLFFLLLNKNDL